MYYSEKFNIISHFVGAILAITGFGALITIAVQQHKWQIYLSFITFGLTLISMYSFSTLYHSFSAAKIKNIFRKLDHIAIYLLIAGTYTPFTLVTLYDSNGVLILITEWSLALIGITLELKIKKRIEVLQLTIYLLMGWLIAIDFPALQTNLSSAGVYWLVFGGIAYTTGVIFYVLDGRQALKHAHGIWHLFVLMGSCSHFISIAGFVR
ncbi:MAG: hemolysin III family protein [Proteobacteria bacterium]|nr:hemolysin III family protein [Pseudomonadota bacterium]